MVTLLGKHVESVAIQYDCSAIKSTFVMPIMFLLTLSEMCKFNYMFIAEVIDKGGVILFVLPIYIHEGGGILEMPLSVMQSSTTPPLTMTSMLKHIIE